VALGIGLYVPTWHFNDGSTPRWLEIRTIALDAERLGVDTLWVADEPGFWESWTILAALADATERVGLGPLVACTRYRDPGIFATMVRALDEVSGGRLTLGLGAGVGPRDDRWTAFGIDGTSHIARFGEAVEVIARLLRSGTITHEGAFYRLADPDIGPGGPRPGGPPIWVAAGRPRTLEVACRWADAVNWTDAFTDGASVANARARIAEACAQVGRDPAAVRVTGFVRLAPSPAGQATTRHAETIAGTPSAVAARLLELDAAGLEHITCFIGDEDDDHLYPALTARALDRFAAVLDGVRGAR